MNQAMKANIRAAYSALIHATSGSLEASRLLTQAFEAAVEGEKRHRRMGAGCSRYEGTANLAAEYFVVKWFIGANPLEEKTAAYWATLRADCFYASALKSALNQAGKVPDLSAYRIEEIDYSEHFVKASER